MTRQCVNCPGAEDHSTAQCPLVSEQKNELRQIITDALVSMVSGVTGLVPPAGPGAIPDFIQAPIDRAVERISASLPVGVPDGYAIVPVKPDIEMVEAGYEASLGQPDRSAHARVIEQYDAMLAAAPAQGHQVDSDASRCKTIARLMEMVSQRDAELSALKAHPEAYQFDGQVLRDEHGNYLAEFMAYEQSFIDRLLHPQPALKAQQVGVIREAETMGVAPYADIWPWLVPGTKLYTLPPAERDQDQPQ